MALLNTISRAVGNALGKSCEFPHWLREGTSVIFDPAAHWRNRERDLAVTELLGSCAPNFMRYILRSGA